MTIDDAIVEQQNYLNHSDQWSHERLDEAVQLSIEALKVIKEYHDYFLREGVVPLPGETEE